MNLYEINRDIENFEFEIDETTGEVLNADALDELQMERDTKIENIALYIKNLDALADDIKAEKGNLDERMKAVERKAEGLKRYLASALNGSKFETARCKISYRRSKQVVLAGEFDDWAKENAPELLTVKTTYTPSKTAIKEAMMEGKAVKYATLVENTNLILK